MRYEILAVPLLMAGLFAADKASFAVASKPVVNLYSAPTQDADVVSQAILGTLAEVLENKSGWLKIQTPDRYTGWVEAEAWTQSSTPYTPSIRVAGLMANLYRETDITRRQPLLTLPFSAALRVIEEASDRWLQVELPDGRLAYIQQGDVAPLDRRLNTEESIAFGKRFIGLPYLWGGNSSFGYDCSGFTQMLVQQRGSLMPRDADLQAAWVGAKAVQRDELLPGDLLFFGSSDKHITHTGYYIGSGRFLHATAYKTPVIQISELDDPHWTELLVASRRLR